MVRKLYFWLPAAACMAIIFILSSRQRIAVSEEYVWNFVVFKTLHMIEYAVLFTLLFRAFLAGEKNDKKTALKKAFTFAILYAISDEVHQTFVPTREGTLRDVFIDTAGIGLMYLILKKHFNALYNYLT